MTPQCCGEMGYGGLRVSLLRSEFPSLYVLIKDNGTADTSFSEDRVLILPF